MWSEETPQEHWLGDLCWWPIASCWIATVGVVLPSAVNSLAHQARPGASVQCPEQQLGPFDVLTVRQRPTPAARPLGVSVDMLVLAVCLTAASCLS